jgi:hypothetical protein
MTGASPILSAGFLEWRVDEYPAIKPRRIEGTITMHARLWIAWIGCLAICACAREPATAPVAAAPPTPAASISPGILPYHPTVSFLNPGFPDPEAALNYMCDQLEPVRSNDRRVRHMDFWPHKGTPEWVQYNFESPKRISVVAVYWWDDTGTGESRVPTSWRLVYRDGDAWRPVANSEPFGVERDRFNEVHFTPVTTRALRLEVQQRPDFAAGIIEWKVQ